jgi:hypothetical protein
MATTTSTDLIAYVTEALVPEEVSTFFSNNTLTSLFPPEPAPPGDSIDWAVNYGPSTNYATTYGEDDAAPQPNVEVVLNPEVAKQPFAVTAKISNVALDYLRDNRAGLDMLTWDIKQKTRQLLDLVNTTLLSTFETTAIDATATYGGVVRATYTAWGSYESAVNTTHALSQLEDMYEALLDNDRAVNVGDLICLMPFNQITNYSRVSGNLTTHPTVVLPGQPVDAGLASRLMFNGVPIIGVPDMTDTVVMMGEKSQVHIYETRPVTVTPQGVRGDYQEFLITCNYQIAVMNPAKWGKVTGVTA